MAEHLKLNQWTNLEIRDFIVNNRKPEGLDEALKEAEKYISDRLYDAFVNKNKPQASHTELDICEKLIIAHPFDERASLYLLRAYMIKNDLKPVAGALFYGFLGEFDRDPDSQRIDAVRNYVQALCDEAEMQHDMGKFCDELRRYFSHDDIPDIVAGVSDEMQEYYQYALNYFTNDEVIIALTSTDNLKHRSADDIEPEEKQMLKNMDIYKARNMAEDAGINPDIKVLYTNTLLALAADASDDSEAAAYYEKAAWMDSAARENSRQIVSGLKNRLDKNECITKPYKDRIGILAEQANSLCRLFHDAPFESIPKAERVKSFGIAIICLAAAILLVLTPLRDYITGDGSLAPFIIIIVTCVTGSVGGFILAGLIGLFGGFLLGSIAGYVVCLAAGFMPVIALIAAFVFAIKALRPDSSYKKAYDKYVDENKIVDKAKKLMNDAVVVKNAFNVMNQCEGLDEIKAYYDAIIQDARTYINIISR